MGFRCGLVVAAAAVLVAVNGTEQHTGPRVYVTTKMKHGRNVTTVLIPNDFTYTLDCPQPEDRQRVFVVQVKETPYMAPVYDTGEDCENQYINPDKLCSTIKASSCFVQARDPSSDAGCKGRPLRIKYSCVEPPKFTSGPILDNMGIPSHNSFPGGLASAGPPNIAGRLPLKGQAANARQ